jgi:GcrA cell cycle regulator
MSWTPELTDALRRMWAEGWSASQIAGELQVFTRNAVLGRVHRLGLSRQDKPHRSRSTAKPKRKPTFSAITLVGPMTSRVSRPNLVEQPRIELPMAPRPKMLSILELTVRTCRWPIGDPQSGDFGFCGHQCPPDQPYCQHHRLLSKPVRLRGGVDDREWPPAASANALQGLSEPTVHCSPADRKVA